VKTELKSGKRIKRERDENSPSNDSVLPFKKVEMLDSNEAIDLTD
jgi:hypothetical protein